MLLLLLLLQRSHYPEIAQPVLTIYLYAICEFVIIITNFNRVYQFQLIVPLTDPLLNWNLIRRRESGYLCHLYCFHLPLGPLLSSSRRRLNRYYRHLLLRQLSSRSTASYHIMSYYLAMSRDRIFSWGGGESNWD